MSRNRLLIVFVFAQLTASVSAAAPACLRQATDGEGVIHAQRCSIPPSSLASDAARTAAIENGRASSSVNLEEMFPKTLSTREFALRLRATADVQRKKIAQEMLNVYPVSVTPETIGGVQTDVVVPSDGITSRNRDRVLLNLHGGGMILGARYEGQIMSIPIASVGKIKVVTV